MIRSPPDIDLLKQVTDLISSHPSNLSSIHSFLEKLKNKYHSKILYALSILKFSSYWELSTILNLGDMRQVRRCIDSFIEDGTITIVKKHNEDYQIICTFWHKHYPTSPCIPTLFAISEDWCEVAKGLTKNLEHFYNIDEISKLHSRAKQYLDHHTIVKNQIKLRKKRIKGALGVCQVPGCGRLIPKDARQGYEYQIYGEMMVCNNCRSKATLDQIRKWRIQKT